MILDAEHNMYYVNNTGVYMFDFLGDVPSNGCKGLRMDTITRDNPNSRRRFLLEDPDAIYIEVAIRNDYARYMNHRKDVYELEQESIRMIAFANLFFYQHRDRFNPSINVVLVDQYTITTDDNMNTLSDIGYLEDLRREHSTAPETKNYDVLLGLTDLNTLGTTNGIAYMNAACSEGGYSTSVVKSHHPHLEHNPYAMDLFTAVTIAHEIGHIVGISHDPGTSDCPSGKYIMSARTNIEPFTEFSPCSIIEFNDNFKEMSNNFQCLFNEPSTFSLKSALPVCGDGVVDTHEDCDSQSDPCCDPETCRFREGAVCGVNDPCCDVDTCTVTKSISKVCRPATGFCDIPDTCDGIHEYCPEYDMKRGTGERCGYSNSNGRCYNGDCIDADAVCKLTFQAFNEDTSQTTYCGDWSTDNVCSRLFCTVGDTCNEYMVATPPDGLACGQNEQCYQEECVDSQLLSRYNWRYDWQLHTWVCFDTTDSLQSSLLNTALCCESCLSVLQTRFNEEHGFVERRYITPNETDTIDYCQDDSALRNTSNLYTIENVLVNNFIIKQEESGIWNDDYFMIFEVASFLFIVAGLARFLVDKYIID